MCKTAALILNYHVSVNDRTSANSILSNRPVCAQIGRTGLDVNMIGLSLKIPATRASFTCGHDMIG